MKNRPPIIAQMLILVLLGVLLGFGGNALRDGKHYIKPMNNYFKRATATTRPQPAQDDQPSGDPNAATVTADPNAAGPDDAPTAQGGSETAADEQEWIGQFRVIDYAEAKALHEDPRTQYRAIVFVDARDDNLFLDGHIPHAIQVYPYNTEYYMERALPILMAAETVVVYCTSETCDDSVMAAEELRHYGIMAEILIYKDGWEDWVAQGGPTESGDWQ